MCNCYQITPPAFRKSALVQRWQESLKGDHKSFEDWEGLLVRPTVTAPVYTLGQGCSGMRWGFERPWAKSINNARIEKRGTMWKHARDDQPTRDAPSCYLALMATWFEGKESPAKFEAVTR